MSAKNRRLVTGKILNVSDSDNFKSYILLIAFLFTLPYPKYKHFNISSIQIVGVFYNLQNLQCVFHNLETSQF